MIAGELPRYLGGFSDVLDFYNPQFPDSMVCPECDQKIPNEDELYLSSGFIWLGVVSDLGWIFGKLIKKPDQSPVSPGFHEYDSEKRKPGGKAENLKSLDAAIEEATGDTSSSLTRISRNSRGRQCGAGNEKARFGYPPGSRKARFFHNHQAQVVFG